VAPTHARAASQPTQAPISPLANPGEPITHDHNRETKPLTFGPIGWSFRRVRFRLRWSPVDRCITARDVDDELRRRPRDVDPVTRPYYYCQEQEAGSQGPRRVLGCVRGARAAEGRCGRAATGRGRGVSRRTRVASPGGR
jgi:hypothetical protein